MKQNKQNGTKQFHKDQTTGKQANQHKNEIKIKINKIEIE